MVEGDGGRGGVEYFEVGAQWVAAVGNDADRVAAFPKTDVERWVVVADGVGAYHYCRLFGAPFVAEVLRGRV